MCLGLEITKNKYNEYSISQKNYIRGLREKFQLQNKVSSKVRVPLSTSLKLFDTTTDRVDSSIYRSLIGSILYVSVATRPDISQAISALASFSNEPRTQHIEAAYKLIQYLYNTMDYTIQYSRNHPDLESFCDAAHKVDPKQRSRTGYYVSHANGPISWKSFIQKNTTKCTAHAEYYAMSATTSIMHVDNTAAIAISENAQLSEASKAIHLQYHSTREEIKRGIIKPQHIRTDINPADILTKPLSVQVTRRHASKMFSNVSKY